jgi:hypothetical protein
MAWPALLETRKSTSVQKATKITTIITNTHMRGLVCLLLCCQIHESRFLLEDTKVAIHNQGNLEMV